MTVDDYPYLPQAAYTDLQNAIFCVNRLLAYADYSSALWHFNHHAHEALHHLEEWARANNIELRLT